MRELDPKIDLQLLLGNQILNVLQGGVIEGNRKNCEGNSADVGFSLSFSQTGTGLSRSGSSFRGVFSFFSAGFPAAAGSVECWNIFIAFVIMKGKWPEQR